MKNILSVLSVFALVACQGPSQEVGSGGGSPGAPDSGTPDDPVEVVHGYEFIPMNDGSEFAGSITVNLGEPDQATTNINQHVILPGVPQDVTVFGRTVNAQFTRHSGPELTVEMWRDGILHDIKTTSGVTTSIFFSVDF